MKLNEKLKILNAMLLEEMPEYRSLEAAFGTDQPFDLFRALCNLRPAGKASREFLELQDEVLQEISENAHPVPIDSLSPVPSDERLYIWQGDITRLQADAVVNAANSSLLGCFIPNHNCIDNHIHTKAGVELRLACQTIMDEQDHPEETGTAKITPAFNLPADYVIHTVGPRVGSSLTQRDIDQLESCYRSVLDLADANGLESLAFCCISTGVFHFPNDRAARIATETVRDYLDTHPETSLKKIVFNVFQDRDRILYERLLDGSEGNR